MKPNVTNDDIYKLQQDENIDKASINKEVKNFNSNDTDITTTTKKESSSSNILKWLRKINLEFNIPITTAYQKELIPLLMKFDESIIYYAIQYASKHGKNPKVFLLKVLQNWSDKGIKSLSEVINYNVQTTDNITSKELTPKWLNNPEQLRNKQLTPEERIKFEKQREAFKQQLIKDWEN